MDAILLCGGAGTRLRGPPSGTGGGVAREKPLVPVGGTPMVERVHAALADSRVERVHVAVSPLAPETARYARERSWSVVETPGEGYVADLGHALDEVGVPVLTVAADLPLLTAGLVDAVLDALGRVHARQEDGLPSVAACVPAWRKHGLGLSVDDAFVPGPDARVVPPTFRGVELAPTGLNVVGARRTEDRGDGTDGGDGDDGTGGDAESAVVWACDDRRLAVNVNHPGDLTVAEGMV